MSYCSENKIPADVSLGRVIEVIELLGYIKVRNPLKTKAQVAFYVWNGDKKSISFAGIELYIYKYADCISVQTRTSIGRSYWDLKHQNKTISLIRSLFGGSFTTDEGNNRYTFRLRTVGRTLLPDRSQREREGLYVRATGCVGEWRSGFESVGCVFPCAQNNHCSKKWRNCWFWGHG